MVRPMKTRIRDSSWLFQQIWCLYLCVAFLLGGLAACAPNSFPQDSLAFVHPGNTTRAEVIENFNTPTYDLKEPHVIAYLKDTIVGSAPHSTLDRTQSPLLYHEDPGQADRETELLCFLLDDHDHVLRFGKIMVDGKTQPQAAITEWAKGRTVK